MNRRKIAAFVAASAFLLGTPSLSAQTGNAAFDECVIACLEAGGGQQGDGRLCRIICARQIDFPPPGGGAGTGDGGPVVVKPDNPDGGCPGTRLPCRPQ